jgi:hypothetical protein
MSASVPHRESGNVLFYILLAVVLFAALSFAVARIMQSGSGNPNREVGQLHSSDLIQYADGLKRAVQTMRIRSVEDGDFSFETPDLAGYAPHASCSADSCRIFKPAGGGMNYMPPPDDWLDPAGDGQPLYREWFFPAGVCVQGVGTGGAGCDTDGEDNEELVVILPWVKRELCIMINERLGVINTGGNPPVASGPAWGGGKFTGTFADGTIIARAGETAACLRDSGGASYFYYKVLLAR